MSFGTMLGQLATGMLVTGEIFFLTLLFSLPLGLVISFGRMSKNGLLRTITKINISIMRGTPLMLQLIVVYFAPYYIFRIRISSGYRMIAVIIGFVLNYAAYFAEIYRSGIQSIPKGQLEGAMSLGFSKWESMVRIIIPQAIRNILPVIGNEFVTLIKESSQVSVIGMADLMYTATTIQGISFQPFPPLVIVAIYYFIMTFFVSMCLRVLERRMKVKSVR